MQPRRPTACCSSAASCSSAAIASPPFRPRRTARVNARRAIPGPARSRTCSAGAARFAPACCRRPYSSCCRRATRCARTAKAGIRRSAPRTLDDTLFFHSAYPPPTANAVFFGPDTYRFAQRSSGSPRSAGRCDARSTSAVAPGRARCWSPARGRTPKSSPSTSTTGRFATPASTPPRRHHARRCPQVRPARQRRRRLRPDRRQSALPARPRPARSTGTVAAASARGCRWPSRRWPPRGSPRAARCCCTPAARSAAASIACAPGWRHACRHRRWQWDYREIDPDVFGEELLEPAYAEADRIAAVLVQARRGGAPGASSP